MKRETKWFDRGHIMQIFTVSMDLTKPDMAFVGVTYRHLDI